MLGLALASLWSWTVIIDKTVPLRRPEPRGRPVRGRRSPPAEPGGRRRRGRRAARATPCRACCRRALQEWRDARAKGLADRQPGRLPDPAHRPGARRHHRPREPARSRTAWARWPSSPPPRPSSACSARSGASCTPSRPSPSRRTPTWRWSRPSIAEALFATAIGLVAAIPAYIAYNKFSTDAGKFAGRLEGFADDLSHRHPAAPGGAGLSHGALGQRRLRRRRRRGRRRRGRGRRGALSEINVTPLVDVMLVLLIIFMISAPLLTAGVPVSCPRPRPAPCRTRPSR